MQECEFLDILKTLLPIQRAQRMMKSASNCKANQEGKEESKRQKKREFVKKMCNRYQGKANMYEEGIRFYV